jgi:hypothetical protein
VKTGPKSNRNLKFQKNPKSDQFRVDPNEKFDRSPYI